MKYVVTVMTMKLSSSHHSGSSLLHHSQKKCANCAVKPEVMPVAVLYYKDTVHNGMFPWVMPLTNICVYEC
jgi:hypothetical protein